LAKRTSVSFGQTNFAGFGQTNFVRPLSHGDDGKRRCSGEGAPADRNLAHLVVQDFENVADRQQLRLRSL